MADVNSGMTKQEMKHLLKVAKEQPVNCSFGVGAESAFALLVMDKIKAPKGLEKELEKQFAGAKSLRCGTAHVDAEEDAKLLKFTINRAVSGMARRLVKTLKGTGITKIQILLEDGTLIDGVEEEDEEEAAHENDAAQAAAPVPDAAHLNSDLASLIHVIQGVTDPATKAALAKLAGEVNGQLKAGNPTQAATLLDQLRHGLAQPNGGTPHPAEPTSAGAVLYDKSRLAWLAARKKIEAEIRRLHDEIVLHYEHEEGQAEVSSSFSRWSMPVLETLDVSLADKLEEARNASDSAQRANLVAEARVIMDSYQQFLKSNATLADLDSNPFLPLSIRDTVGNTISALSKVVR